MDVEGGSSWATSERTPVRLQVGGRAAIYATRGTRLYDLRRLYQSRRPCGSAGRPCPSRVFARRRRSWICWGIRTTRCWRRSGPARDVCVLVMSYIIDVIASVLQDVGVNESGTAGLAQGKLRNSLSASSSQASASNTVEVSAIQRETTKFLDRSFISSRVRDHKSGQ